MRRTLKEIVQDLQEELGSPEEIVAQILQMEGPPQAFLAHLLAQPGMNTNLTITDAAKEFGVHPVTLKKRIDAGELVRVWVDSKPRIPRWQLAVLNVGYAINFPLLVEKVIRYLESELKPIHKRKLI